ncbi:MAG TPA: MerR family transcriptional regulator [Methylomirabilota bacterium]|nr:MerR family transcriptional regulator [Methylomirabilota bacterium]
MLIGEVAKLSDVSKDTVRLYTQKGLIICSQKRAGSRLYADYDPSIVELIKGIRITQSLGFTLTELKPLAEEYVAGRLSTKKGRAVLKEKLKEIEKKQRQ